MKKILTMLGLVVVVFLFGFTTNGNVSKEKCKVTLCHNGHEITIDESAVAAHLCHGDTIGECDCK